MNIHPELVREVRRYRRHIVGDFMDKNPGVFTSPAAATSWVDFFAKNDEILGSDRVTVEKALGLFAQVFRHAQHAMLSDASMRLDDFLSGDNFPDLEEVLMPDEVALLIVGGEDSDAYTSEIVAFARMISMFKFLVNSGRVTVDSIYGSMCGSLDDVPNSSALQRTAVDAIKQMVQRDLEMMLQDDFHATPAVH